MCLCQPAFRANSIRGPLACVTINVADDNSPTGSREGLRHRVVGNLSASARICVDASPELRGVIAVYALDRFPGR